MDHGIKPLDPNNRHAVAHAAQLHSTLLPDSPVSRLGQAFMRRFYYRKLVGDGLVCCDLYYHQGTPAGFLAYTKHPADFMALGLRRHWLYLMAVMAGGVFCRPTRVGVMLGVVAMLRTRQKEQLSGRQGELLSFGVLREYRTTTFMRQTGQRISLELFENAKRYFQREKITTLRLLVQADNRETLLFYHALGCHFVTPVGSTENTVFLTYVIPE